MTDTRDQFHERESQVAPPVRSGEVAHVLNPLAFYSPHDPWEVVRCDDGSRMVCTHGDIICHSAPLHGADDPSDIALFPLIAAAPDMHDSIDPDTLEAIADEIDCFEHSARAGSLRSIAKRQRAAIAKATMTAPQREQSPLSREKGDA